MIRMMIAANEIAKVCLAFAMPVMLVISLKGVMAAPPLATDKYTSPCSRISDSLAIGPAPFPENSFKLWSKSSSWPGGIIPGIGSAVKVNVTIPCGTAVLLDVKSVDLSLLRIVGLLRFKDDPSLPVINVKADFVLVEGQLTIGTPTQQFKQKATIELTPNTRNNRAPLKFTSFAPADAANPRDLGHKTFAVVGGQVHLHGLPGSQLTPSWTRLIATANPDDDYIIVEANVVGLWPVASQILVVSTDYSRSQSEVFTVKSLIKTAAGTTKITLNTTLNYMHYGQKNGLSDGFGGFVDQRAEVALLTRNIVITGTQELSPYNLEGGHFIVFMTPSPQYIEGVRFFKMGQQGTLGRYPVHFHINGNSPKTLCNKNTIESSNQRCIVIHASHNMSITNNVAYNNKGHCFLVEEGGETGNTFSSNLGAVSEPVTKKISPDETDDSPATFWISNPYNNYINNVAGGSADSGYWIELRSEVRGDSLKIPSLKSMSPFYMSLGIYSGNTAHSNDAAGFRTYPNGLRPRVNGDYGIYGKPGTISSLNLYKNGWIGMFVHNTDLLTITSSIFADNYWALFLHQDNKIQLTKSRVVALTKNYGNPYQCYDDDIWASCRPIVGCKMPLRQGTIGRSTGIGIRTAPVLGVLIDVDSRFQSVSEDNSPNSITDTTFSGFNATCWTSAAIALINDGEGEYWNSGHNIKGLKFTADSNRIWTPPRKFVYVPWGDQSDGLESSKFYNIWDKDGSIVGSGGGYVIANTPALLPVAPKKCTYNAVGNSYYCPGTCYRTLQVKYIESAFKVGLANLNNKHGAYSYLEITRLADGKVLTVDGNMNQFSEAYTEDYTSSQRFFSFTLLAGQTYTIRVVPGTTAPNFFPTKISVGYVDYSGCGTGLTLRFKPQTSKPWKGITSPNVFFKQCPGSNLLPATGQYGLVCVSGVAFAEVTLGTVLAESVVLQQTTGSTACAVPFTCSVFWGSRQDWKYEASGKELRPEFYNPLANTVSWKTGKAPLGIYWDTDYVITQLPLPSLSRLTYYFRNSFTLKNTACITSLQIEIFLSDGAIVYLNNKQLLRANMPSGRITSLTTALSHSSTFPYWKTYTISLPSTTNAYFLVEGVNYIAVEQHMASEYEDEIGFDLRIAANHKGPSCTGAVKTPEVCDGVDNDNSGSVDKKADGTPLTQPCATSCGNGTATCVSGSYQKCTARPSYPEICNGIDDNCDGLVDNGNATLNCGTGKVCSAGKCLPVAKVSSSSSRVWPRNSTGWYYYDKGGNLDSSNPNWRKGTNVNTWKQGKGPLGYNYILPTPKWDTFGTTINFFAEDDTSVTAYFAKSFSLTQADIDKTYNIYFNVRRVDGAVVYLNGVELWRTNLPSGTIKYTTQAIAGTDSEPWVAGTDCCNLQWTYEACTTCTHKTVNPLKVGVNYITAELHLAWTSKENAAFDMDLYRAVTTSCASLPGNPATCARAVTQTIFPLSTTGWQYADASSAVPPSTWMKKTYSSSSWKSGQAPFGYGDLGWLLNTTLNGGTNTNDVRRTFYFRKTVQVPDGACYFQLNSTLLAKDGAVVYINGAEAYRYNLPNYEIDSTTFASTDSDWDYHSTTLSGGWLVTGANLIAVELHRYVENNEYIFFDLELKGQREGVTCSPQPI